MSLFDHIPEKQKKLVKLSYHLDKIEEILKDSVILEELSESGRELNAITRRSRLLLLEKSLPIHASGGKCQCCDGTGRT